MMDYTSTFSMLKHSTLAVDYNKGNDDGDIVGVNDSDDVNDCAAVAGAGVKLHERVKNIRLTRLHTTQSPPSLLYKMRLVLLLLGLWMNLIGVTNGK